MKNYHDLTEDQKKAAIRYFFNQFKELFSDQDPFFEIVDGPVTDDFLEEHAENTAEQSFYSESGDRVVEGIA